MGVKKVPPPHDEDVVALVRQRSISQTAERLVEERIA
jgi:hypothetical protein